MELFRADLHVHTHYSLDSAASPVKIILRAKAAGLDAIAVTDHDSANGWKAMKGASKKFCFPVVYGEEVKVIEGGKVTGELIGLFLTEPVKVGDPLCVIDDIKRQGGIAVIPHPYDTRRAAIAEPERYARHVHGVEVLNARTTEQANRKALELAWRVKLAKTGGSDAHSVGEVGKAWTQARVGDLDEFRKALEKKKTDASGETSSMLVRVISNLAKTGIMGRP